MYYRCELLVGGNVHDVTNDLVNWDDVEMSFKRNDYDGVVRSFSTKFEFSGGAYSLLLREYQSNYLKSSATIVFYVRNNSWLLNEKFRCALDYSTFTYTDISCEINAVDNSLASLIKAKKGTQYEYLVSELKEAEPLYYDRLEMSSNIEWVMTGTHEEKDGKSYYYNIYDFGAVSIGNQFFTVPLYMKNTEIAVKDVVEVQDVGLENLGGQAITSHCIFKNISDHGVYINIKAKFKLHLEPLTITTTTTCYIKMFYFYNENKGQGWIPIANSTPLHGGEYKEKVPISFGENIIEINSEKFLIYGNGGYIVLAVYGQGKVKIFQEEKSSSEETLAINFMEQDAPVDINVIKPTVLLNRLLKSINGGNEGVTGEISIPAGDAYKGVKNAMIAPAESIRGIPNAKIYTSYTKFANWMSSVFGFVPVIGENKVTFVHRDVLFQDKLVKDLKDDTVDLNYNVSSSMIYSRLKVGYDKQDYDSVNGRDEFHFTNEYTTGITLTENAKELISPYRADAYGIEFLAAKRGEDTTDNDSDSDIFFVGAALEGGKYKLVRSGYTISGVISPSTMFNAMYSQRYMIEANARYLAAFAEQLSFTSSDGNSDVEINGVRETNDIALGNRLFTVGELSVETGDQGTPSDLSGYIRIEKNGNVYKGYVKSVSYNHGKAKPVKYSLIVKSVE